MGGVRKKSGSTNGQEQKRSKRGSGQGAGGAGYQAGNRSAFEMDCETLKDGRTTGISRYASQAKVSLEKNWKQRELFGKMIK